MQVTRIDRARATRGNPSYFDGEVNVQTLVSSTGEEPELLAVFFNPGARTFPHVHEHDQNLHIITGKGIVATETEKHFVTQGDLVTVPAGTWHWHGATQDTAMCHISIKRPGNDNWSVDRKNWDSGYDA